MDAKELRIGNYIQSEPLSIPRVGIITDGVVQTTGYGISVIESDTNNSMGFRSIPLTAEWLIRFGFKYKSPGAGGQDQWAGYGFWSFNDVHFLGIKDGKILYFNRDRRTQIAYVHQLQNLYFQLVGEELIIK